MHPIARPALGVFCLLTLGCAAASQNSAPAVDRAAKPTLAQVYFWRARPGMSAEYDRYIREIGEPIDREAQRAGAFMDVTTYTTSDTTIPWTHMRVFLLRDSSQLRGLSAALGAAGVRLEPDSVRRQRKGEYASTLRDRYGAAVTRIVQ